ncbi:tRNA A64-2'-O-ribosylphosphate transferase [Radiomyces spectabilis]|uniref:tRNA A64-2'-O-ribosylphosphate transferase n=1 Tax=Radiomyces spectabilis TaxID=64574 RepID=UPI00221E3CAD|nr:tRNA A64-2'-O-ribosylphosphate transferase [Radiomyces spectabilis]KAI8388740.1 tRNA A64-2'-O-ribosylphosphate transferase [Radiomyces spectabilis]
MPKHDIFYGQEFHSEANQIRKDAKNIYNRLKSIEEDSAFVQELSDLFPKYALAANERCGAWYIRPTNRSVYSVYFKSTDGHTGQWDFNLRRNNLHLIDVIAKHEGCIIVDSTRRGKRLPDALSKTIPIWCCTINRAIDRYRKSVELDDQANSMTWDTRFHSPPTVVSKSEHAQIEEKIDMFAQRLLDSGIAMEPLSRALKKPLRPMWFTPHSSLFLDDFPQFEDAEFWPVICLSASQAVETGCQARQGYLYVQGSADDQESWCLGLTRQMFWKYYDELLHAHSPVECEEKVKRIVQDELRLQNHETATEADDVDIDYNCIGNTGITVGNRFCGKPPFCWEQFDAVINCGPTEYSENKQEKYQNKYLYLPIPEGKKGQYAFFESISPALTFAAPFLKEKKQILIYCNKGQDTSIGIALAILVKYYDAEENFKPEGAGYVDKKRIQQQLLKIISSRHKASPSRATLKKVNTYFMS